MAGNTYKPVTRLWQACYIVNDTVKELWQAVEDRCKDYILHPKGNNYQSLHTTVEARASCLPPKFLNAPATWRWHVCSRAFQRQSDCEKLAGGAAHGRRAVPPSAAAPWQSVRPRDNA